VNDERITEAAIIFREALYCGPSHKAAVSAAALILNLSPMTVWAKLKPADMGFLTTRGRFVSRTQAWLIAKRAGQLRRGCSRPGISRELHSEDMQ
jgi:hypothetical protein